MVLFIKSESTFFRRWELILCKYCGSQGVHIGCGRLKWKCPEFECDICADHSPETEEGMRFFNYLLHNFDKLLLYFTFIIRSILEFQELKQCKSQRVCNAENEAVTMQRQIQCNVSDETHKTLITLTIVFIFIFEA